MPARLHKISEKGCRVYLCNPKGFLHAKLLLVDDVALIGSSNWTSNSAKAEELSCIIHVTPAGKLQLLQKFVAWRSMSLEYSSEHFAAAAAARKYPIAKGAVAGR